MADSDSKAAKPAEDVNQKLKKARDILDGMHCRFDPAQIKMKETQTGKRGGQGVVVIGTLSPPEELKDRSPELKVAVKKLEWTRDDAEESAKFFKSFVSELGLMESLSHPNIIELLGFVEDMEKGDAWMILPWEGNGNVREFLQSGEWDVPERISLIQDTAKGLEYLHSRQPPICHGDLKSFNILVNSSYRAVITDFGSARIRQSLGPEKSDHAPAENLAYDEEATVLTSPKVQFNPSTMELTLTGPKFSLRWTAPEVLNNGIQDLPSDMWALGWVGWEIVTGKVPFEELHRDSFVIIHAIKGKFPVIREDPSLSLVLKLCSLMADCWLSDPAKRIQASTFHRRVDKMPSVPPSGYSAGGQKVRSAHLLVELGRTYDLQDDRTMAEVHFRSALDVASGTKDDWAMANALDCLGSVHRAQSRYQEAEKAFTEAHEIHSRIGNHIGVANALDGLGNIYRAQSRYREATKALTEAHEIHSRIGNVKGAATALGGLGEIYCIQSRYQEAEEAFKEAHEMHSRIGSQTGTANALVGLGDTYSAQSKTGEAEKAFNDAQNIFSRIEDTNSTGNTLHNLARLYSDQHRYDDAEASYRLAAACFDLADFGDSKARSLLALGQDQLTRGRYPEAEEVLTEALAIWISIGNEEGQAGAWMLLSLLFKSQLRTDEERDALIQAEAIFARIGRDAARAETLDRLGDIHFAQSAYDEAEECYRLAQAVFSSMDDVRGEATELLSLGRLYVHQSRHDEAEECFADARVASARIADVVGEAKALDGLMQVHVLRRKFADAKAACVEAREMYALMGRPMSDTCHKTWNLVQLLNNSTGSMFAGLFQDQLPTAL